MNSIAITSKYSSELGIKSHRNLFSVQFINFSNIISIPIKYSYLFSNNFEPNFTI